MPGAESVLVVDDDEDLVALETEMLESAGYDVKTARDGCEALDRVAEEMPGLIFLDLRMPRMNGFEFAREFQVRYGRACPIVVVTADENALLRARQLGADACFAKPFEVDDFLAVAAKFLASAKPARSAGSRRRR
jgi:CheY-like chemotaxis protein